MSREYDNNIDETRHETVHNQINARLELPIVINTEPTLASAKPSPIKKQKHHKLFGTMYVDGQNNPPPPNFVLPSQAHATATPKKTKTQKNQPIVQVRSSNLVDIIVKPDNVFTSTQKSQQIAVEVYTGPHNTPAPSIDSQIKGHVQLVQQKPAVNSIQKINEDITHALQYGAKQLKNIRHGSFRKWLSKLFNGSNVSDYDLAHSCAASIMMSTRLKAKNQEIVNIVQIQNLADTYKRASFLSFGIKRNCLNTIDATVKILLSNLTKNPVSLSTLVSVFNYLPSQSKLTIPTFRAIYKNLNTLSIKKQIEFVTTIINNEQQQGVYYPFTQAIIFQIISNMTAPQCSLKDLEHDVNNYFQLVEQRNTQINSSKKNRFLKHKINEPILEVLKTKIENKLHEENLSEATSHTKKRRKHYKTSSLPPKKAEDQMIGSIRGSYIYLGRKEIFVGGVEPGFVGIRMNYAEFENLFEIIIQDQIAANNTTIIERENAYQQQPKTTNRIEFFLGKKDESRKTILEEFAKQGYPVKMVKLDFLDGEKVTISAMAAAKAGAINRLAGNSKALLSFFSKIYRYFRRTSSREQSLNAVKEYFVTQQIASSILGDRVQQAELEPRWNEIKPGIYNREYAISVGMNSKFKDFKKEFIDPDHNSNGQRIKIDTSGNFIKDSNGNYIAVETKGLGETFALQAVLGNFDAFGSSGGNGGYDDQGYFTIDIGHALEQEQNKILNNVSPYLLVPSDKNNAKNFSLFYNTSLIDRVKGLLLLHRAFTGEILPDFIIQSYGQEFAEQYTKVQPVAEKFAKYIEKFKAERHGSNHLKMLLIMQKRWTYNVQKILKVSEHYLDVASNEVGFIDALAKLTSGVSNFNNDKSRQRIQLNHLRFDTEKGEPTVWKKHSEQNDSFSFEATSKHKTATQIKKYIEEFAAHFNIKSPAMKIVHGHLTVTIAKADFNKYCQTFTERNVAQWHKCPLAPSTLTQPDSNAVVIKKEATATVNKTEAVPQTNFASPLSSGKTLLERMSPEQVATIPHATTVEPHKLSPLLQELMARFQAHDDKFDFKHHVTLNR